MKEIAIELNALDLKEITPESLLADETIKSILKAITPETKQVSLSTIETHIYSAIDELPEKVLDLLAYQFHVDFYDLAENLDQKRAFVKDSLKWHMHKGTEWSVKEALRLLGVNAEYLHWKDTGGIPYTFRIRDKLTLEFFNENFTPKFAENVQRAVMESKAARSLLKEINTRVEREEDTELYVGTITITNITQEVGLDPEIMYDLLMKFEARIMDRIDTHENLIRIMIQNHEIQIKTQLEEIKEMLRWKGPDELI